MSALLLRSANVALRLVIAAACCVGVIHAWRLIRADNLYREDTEASIRSAIVLAPDRWEYYMRLAQYDWKHAQELLSTAVRLDPYNAQANIELGLQYEAEGDLVKAESFLLRAYQVDNSYLPRWTLANFYFRQGDTKAFWKWARSAAAMPSGDLDALFDLCWAVSPDPQTVTAAISNNNPEFLRHYVSYLLAKGQPSDAAAAALSLVRNGAPDKDRALMFAVVNSLLATGEASSAATVWHSLMDRQWVVADTTLPNNASFARAPLPVGFDWSLPEYPGLHSWTGPLGLKTEILGNEPESCIIADQIVPLSYGDYNLAFSYLTEDIQPETGVHWEVIDAKSAIVLAHSSDLSSDALQHVAVPFSVEPGTTLVRLRLMYKRPLGTHRISGTVVVSTTEIQPRHAS